MFLTPYGLGAEQASSDKLNTRGGHAPFQILTKAVAQCFLPVVQLTNTGTTMCKQQSWQNMQACKCNELTVSCKKKSQSTPSDCTSNHKDFLLSAKGDCNAIYKLAIWAIAKVSTISKLQLQCSLQSLQKSNHDEHCNPLRVIATILQIIPDDCNVHELHEHHEITDAIATCTQTCEAQAGQTSSNHHGFKEA